MVRVMRGMADGLRKRETGQQNEAERQADRGALQKSSRHNAANSKEAAQVVSSFQDGHESPARAARGTG